MGLWGRLAGLGMAGVLVLGGCRREIGGEAAVAGLEPGGERHFVRGEVLGVHAAAGSVVLRHQAIAGFMPAMTMEYKVADPAALGELHPGDLIAAELLDDRGPDGPRNLRLTEVDVVGQARPDPLPAVAYHVPKAGDEVPDFWLRNQSGRRISLAQYRGKVLVLTFVYTRCPLPEFCIRMSRNFAEIDRRLEADPPLAAKVHLLTVSFDPEYDTPAVLKSYGGAYTGRYTRETFRQWEFAAPGEAELKPMEGWFDVGVTPAAGQLQHSLATVVVGPDGRVRAFYPTNAWTVDEAMAAIRGAV